VAFHTPLHSEIHYRRRYRYFLSEKMTGVVGNSEGTKHGIKQIFVSWVGYLHQMSNFFSLM
jgi:hypothetical protein